jgi:REP element-mobilizing transposase RayT
VQAPGIYHVTCRGNRRQPIFTDDYDRERYLALLAAVSRRLGWRCLAYCLMTNHVHLVLDVPGQTLSRGMQLLSGRYAQAYNRRHGWIGHLFQGRFHSVVVEEEGHSLELARYLVLNPERAGAVARAVDWRWSSHRALLGKAPAPAFLDAQGTRRLSGTGISRGQTPGRVPPGRVPDD